MIYYRIEPVKVAVPCEHGPDSGCGARLAESGLLVHDQDGYVIWDVEQGAPWSSTLFVDRREAEAMAAELELDREPRPHRSVRGPCGPHERTRIRLGDARDV